VQDSVDDPQTEDVPYRIRVDLPSPGQLFSMCVETLLFDGGQELRAERIQVGARTHGRDAVGGLVLGSAGFQQGVLEGVAGQGTKDRQTVHHENVL
jgi:hypothetical protein